MISKLRLTLGILLLGFVIEGTFETYTYFNHNYQLPYASSIFVIGPFITLIGIIILWIGRFEWDEILGRRFRHAHWAFVLNMLALVLAVIPVLWYGFGASSSIPSWVVSEFEAAIVASLFLTFTIYVLIAFELTTSFGRVLLLIALGWAAVVSIWVGRVIGPEFGAIVLMVQDRTMDIRPISESISGTVSLLAVAYFLLTVAYIEAFHRSHARTPRKKSS